MEAGRYAAPIHGYGGRGLERLGTVSIGEVCRFSSVAVWRVRLRRGEVSQVKAV